MIVTQGQTRTKVGDPGSRFAVILSITLKKKCNIAGHCFSETELLTDDMYEGPAKSSVTNRLPWFYPRYILKCFTALEWGVE